jgi:3-oxoadipate enol-lactonase
MHPILWIHGFPLTSAIFEKQLVLEGLQHVAPELPGDAISVDDYARYVVEELDRRSIERATLAGFSMGGYVSFAAWRLCRERIAGLILIDTRETADTEEGRKGRFESIEKIKAQGTAPIIETMLPKMLTKNAPAEMRDRVRKIMESVSAESAIAALRAMAARPDSSELLSTIDVPTLIVVGEEDTITPVADAERMASKIRGARLVKIPNAAHMSNYEQAEIFNAAFRSAVASHRE